MAELSIAEKSARAAALGQYARFLLKRYQRLELIEIGETDPVSLRQIFVPMRVGSEDLREEEVGKGVSRVQDEKLPGEDAWDVLIRKPFVALSGRPGSGKTTLVQAIVAELCNDALPSRLRQETRAIPVPIILRNIPGLETVRSLEDLYNLWWPLQAEQAEHDRLPLDRPRLEKELFPFGVAPQDFSVLVLFDGIDEAGGPAIRQRLLNLALEAAARGFRVLVTGRPTGFVDLVSPPPDQEQPWARLKLCYLLPFAWEQIEQFVDRWYRLRDEWERKRKEGVSRFLGHLEDRGRGYLLSLARRPIFLTLMALVHTTQNQMPEGRPLLYRQIVDLYLERQERQRQRQWTTHGEPMPHWPTAEVRLVLAHLAWQSQSIGSRVKQAHMAEERRVVWGRDKMEEAIRRQIEEGPGRFAELTAANAPALVEYFLHPAGLLVEPEEGKIQFAHLSFQEYLCAWFLHERAKVDKSGMEKFLRDELFAHLDEPGWDEMGILLLRIRADETGQEGHFELLRWLELADPAQAALFVTAVSGRELPFTDLERLGYLPAAVACALVHPESKSGAALSKVPEWGVQGLALIGQLLEAEDDACIWRCIEVAAERKAALSDAMKRRWLEPPTDGSWKSEDGPSEARAHALLRMLNLSGWIKPESISNPIADAALEGRLARFIRARIDVDNNILMSRKMGNLSPSRAGCELNYILPAQGELWRLIVDQLNFTSPLFYGEIVEGKVWLGPGQVTSFLALFPIEKLPLKAVLGVLMYQIILFTGGMAYGLYDAWQIELEPLRISLITSDGIEYAQRSRLLSQRSRLLSLVYYRSLWVALPEESAAILEATLRGSVGFNQVSLSVVPALWRLCLRAAAHDWFKRQAEDPYLNERRGFRPGEPLPLELGLFSVDGLPLRSQSRHAWERLSRWLNDDEAILSFTFPKGLTLSERDVLLADLARFREQRHLSPHSRVKALLQAWPADEPERSYTLEAADLDLRAACEEALAARETKKPKKWRRW
ncbi:MAG TPA: NACHT domain-containing protein [Thermoanaerobaculia bacterium]|nr:NACHT domain-containing protein [Thermoanaerobaculia bacterium]